MEVIVRPAVIEDYDELCEIYKELDELHRLKHPEIFVESEGTARSKEYIEAVINEDNSALFVAEAGSKVIGFAECYIVQAKDFPVIRKREWLQLDDIAVKTGYQNQYIGTLLFNKVIEWGKLKEMNRIELRVYTFNANAIEFYLKNGFKEMHKGMYLDLI